MDNPNKPSGTGQNSLVPRCEHDVPTWKVCEICTAAVKDAAPYVGVKTPTPLSVFDAMLKAGMITTQRGNIYGHPTDNFSLIQKLKEHVRACKDPVLREVLEAICVKIARLVNHCEHLDSWVDIAGYARTAAMHLERKAANDGKPV